MKLLIICNRIDYLLKDKIEKLRLANIDVTCFTINDFTIHKSNERVDITPKSVFVFLEKIPRLGVFNKLIKRVKVINFLGNYDVIDIHQSSWFTALVINKLIKKSSKIVVTITEQFQKSNNPVFKNLILKQYKKVNSLIFTNKKAKIDFQSFYGSFEEKSKIIRYGIKMFDELDKTDEQNIQTIADKYGVDNSKNILYCDMNTTLKKQKDFVNEILKIDVKSLDKMLFIFPLTFNEFNDRKELKAYLDNVNFDHIVLDKFLPNSEKAALLKLSSAAIVLSNDQNNTILQEALYAKKPVFTYQLENLDSIYQKNGIQIEKFSDFTQNKDLYKDISIKNYDQIKKLFHWDNFINQYINFLEEK